MREWWWMMMNDDEWWWWMIWMMMNDDEWWWMMMNDAGGWWFQAVEGFWLRTNERTDICDCRVAFATENENNKGRWF